MSSFASIVAQMVATVLKCRYVESTVDMLVHTYTQADIMEQFRKGIFSFLSTKKISTKKIVDKKIVDIFKKIVDEFFF